MTEYKGYMKEYQGTETTLGEDVTVEIPKGASSKQIAKILKQNGLIKYESAFKRRLEGSEYVTKIKPGTYTLNTGWNTLDMIEAMCPKADSNEPIDKLVVPEGFTIDQIARRCEEQGICSAEEFRRAANSVTATQFEYLADVPTGANVKYKLEGYLFPATYNIYANTTADDLVKQMYQAFEYQFSDVIKQRADELGMSSYEVITRASIIEREVRVPDERAVVAGVINNRLKAGMKLQMCPTVLYTVTDGLYNQATVKYKDLETDSAYNTYKISGLPAGPICNPGMDCIYAVLYPETHNYLYYHVGDEESGAHVFTETYEQHVNTQIIDDRSEEEKAQGGIEY